MKIWLHRRIAASLLVLFALGGCTQAELAGPVSDAAVAVTELRSGALVLDNIRTETKASYIARGAEPPWKDLNGLQKMIMLGNFKVDPALVSADTLYLVTVTGGVDNDANSDQKVDKNPTPVAGSLHAIVRGSDFSGVIVNVSTLSEAAYQNVRADIPMLSDAALLARLDGLAQAMLTDTNRDKQVDYSDLLAWSVFANVANYQLDYSAVESLQQAIYANLPEAELAALAGPVVGEQQVDAQQVFNDTISGPIIMARCITCHTMGGVAMINGARIIFVNSGNSDHLALNHQEFVDLAAIVDDIVTRVTRRAQGLDGHGGGVQLSANNPLLQDLEDYLKLL